MRFPHLIAEELSGSCESQRSYLMWFLRIAEELPANRRGAIMWFLQIAEELSNVVPANRFLREELSNVVNVSNVVLQISEELVPANRRGAI